MHEEKPSSAYVYQSLERENRKQVGINVISATIIGISFHFLLGAVLVAEFGSVPLKMDPFFIIVFSIIVYLSSRNFLKPRPLNAQFRYHKSFSLLVLTIFILELAYFGVPILGHTSYTKFGFPVLHHFVANAWILLVVTRRPSVYTLIGILIIAVCIANRTLFFAALVAFFIAKPPRIMNLITGSALTAIIFTMIGIARAKTGVFSDVELLPGLVVPEQLFFLVLYVIGPAMAVLDTGSSFEVVSYWNTVPEWMLSREIPVYLNFIIFYGAMYALMMVVINRLWLNVLFYPIAVHLPLTFFSGYLYTTTTISAVLILLTLSFRIRFDGK